MTTPGYNYSDCDFMDDGIGEKINRLSAYEDTGLMPDEIKDHEEMFKAYRHVCGGKSPEEVKQALRENTKWEIGCEYCKSGHDLSTGNACEPSLYIQGSTLLALRYDEPDSEAEIHYCPMCGRDLRKPVQR